MKSILNDEKNLVAELQKTGKGGTIGIFDDLCINSGLGFKLIPYATDLLLNQMKPDTFLAALSLLYICVCESKTTEIPQVLVEKWATIKKKVEENGDKESTFLWDELSRWYRIDCLK